MKKNETKNSKDLKYIIDNIPFFRSWFTKKYNINYWFKKYDETINYLAEKLELYDKDFNLVYWNKDIDLFFKKINNELFSKTTQRFFKLNDTIFIQKRPHSNPCKYCKIKDLIVDQKHNYHLIQIYGGGYEIANSFLFLKQHKNDKNN